MTGQIVIGTGVITELKSSITDFFGSTSNSFSEKISFGEKNCFAQLRQKSLLLNCDAIIATDIDYSELGSLKGMIMVCASGTAVKNLDLLGETGKIIRALRKSYNIASEINKFKESLVSY